jgi:O-antigen ligase
MQLTPRFIRETSRLTWAWALPLFLVFVWPWVLGPSLTVVPFSVGLIAVALAGLVLRPSMPLPLLVWLAAVVGVAWLSGGGDNEAKAGLLAAAAACGVLVSIGRKAQSQRSLTQAFVTAVMLAMVLHVAVAWLQFFNLERAFYTLVNQNSSDRPYGNLRQANHLASFALLGLLAVWWRFQRGTDERNVTVILAVLAYSGVALSSSRTGLLSCVAVSVGLFLLSRRLSRFEWCVFLLGPLWVALISFVLPFIGLDSASAMIRSNGSVSARFLYWGEAWDLALRHPLFGVGWSELARARFEQLDLQPGLENTYNAHNLVLHLMAEVGFVGAAVILLPVGFLLWRQRPWRALPKDAVDVTDRVDLGLAWLVLAVVGLHSMLEYPLWYMPFFIPTAFAFGLLITRVPIASLRSLPRWAVASGAGVLMLSTVLALADYARVSTAYEYAGRPFKTPALVSAAQDTVLFSRYADLAWLSSVRTTPENTPQVLAATNRVLSAGPSQRLLWVRLSALCETGQKEQSLALAPKFKAHFPDVYAKFMSLQNPTMLAGCGL